MVLYSLTSEGCLRWCMATLTTSRRENLGMRSKIKVLSVKVTCKVTYEKKPENNLKQDMIKKIGPGQQAE